jgi:hypothetical protein
MYQQRRRPGTGRRPAPVVKGMLIALPLALILWALLIHFAVG